MVIEIQLTWFQFGLWIFDDVTSNARDISAICNSLVQLFEEVVDVDVSSTSVFQCCLLCGRENPEEWQPVRPIVADTSQITKLSLAFYRFVQHMVVDGVVDANAIIQRQADIERKALKVAVGINIRVGGSSVLKELIDACRALEVDNG